MGRPRKILNDEFRSDNDKQEENSVESSEEIAPDNFYTYIGSGEDSPRVINFMGLQQFVRGKSQSVTNPVILQKIKKHPCFTQGDVDEEELHSYDALAKQMADAQRKHDMAINRQWQNKHNCE